MALIKGKNFGSPKGLDNSTFQDVSKVTPGGKQLNVGDSLDAANFSKSNSASTSSNTGVEGQMTDLSKPFIGRDSTVLEKASFPDFNSNPRFGVVDRNTAIFRYGLWSDNKLNEYEDPTYLGFTMEIDTTEKSPFFHHVEPFLTEYSLYNKEIKQRLFLYNKFRELIVHFLKSQESGDYYKSHYINTISGVNKFTQKFIKPDDNFIEIDMHEDCGIRAAYLAYLYNNLVWSYTNGKELIPKNLQRFNLRIKISEIRNLTSIRLQYEKEDTTASSALLSTIRNNITCQIITLHNCMFDFSESSNYGDSITVAGIGAGLPNTASLKFKIRYDSVSRYIRPALTDPYVSIDDEYEHLGFIEAPTSAFQGDPSAVPQTYSKPRAIPKDSAGNIVGDPTEIVKLKKEGKLSTSVVSEQQSVKFLDRKKYYFTRTISDTDKYLPGLKHMKGDYDKAVDTAAASVLGKFQDTSKDNAEKTKSSIKEEFSGIGNAAKGFFDERQKQLRRRLKDDLNRKKGKLLSDISYEIQKKAKLNKIQPPNVYQGNPPIQEFIEGLKSDIGLDILNRGKRAASRIGSNALNNIFGNDV